MRGDGVTFQVWDGRRWHARLHVTGRAASESYLRDVIGVRAVERDRRHAQSWLLVEQVALEGVGQR